MTRPTPSNALATQWLREELAYLKLPVAPWTPPDEQLDVAIIGGGMFGIAAAVALVLKGVRNIRLFDNGAPGRSGPWTTYARMPTLRSPKDLPGLAMGIRALTFRAWYEAVHGVEAWEALYKIPNGVWQDYLNWIVEAFELPIEHHSPVRSFNPDEQGVSVTLADGSQVRARRLVVASGRAGTGGPSIPGFIAPQLFPALAAHTCDDIDFKALAGRRVAVIGVGSSAWDNAATALEQGAAHVTLYARRSHLPQINKAKASTYPGFVEGWQTLPAADRWTLASYFDDTPPPPPHETVLRTLAAAGDQRFTLHFNTRFEHVAQEDGQVVLALEGRVERADFLIVGTGFRVDLAQAPLFSEVADRVALWRDRFEPARVAQRPHLGAFPWLGEGYELQARDQQDGASVLNRVHLFNHAASVSYGAVASDIPAISAAAQQLAVRIVARLFAEGFSDHHRYLVGWEAEWELEKTPYLHK
ncbi:NAD(P)-binding domain-containing protein [Pseudomonas putida]